MRESDKIISYELNAIEQILASDILSGFRAYSPYDMGGKFVQQFEDEFKNYTGSKYALSFNSATSALHTALLACGIEAGDKVLTSPLTFSASASCIKMVGAEVVFADINPQTYCLNIPPKPDVQAIIPVHLWGYPMPIPKLEGVYIIEDAAQAIGATRNGKMVGTFGDCGVFSFNQYKQLNTGEGGMLVTDNAEIYEKARLIRNHGETQSPTLGYNYRMTEITAAIGLARLRQLGQNLRYRRHIAQILNKELFKLGISPPYLEAGCEHSYYCYAIRVGNVRDTLQELLLEKGIYFGKGGMKPLHLLPFYGGHTGQYPEAECVEREVMFTDIFKPPMPIKTVCGIIREMKKLWQGVSFDKEVVKEGDSEQEIVIAMTEDEYKDISYREYLRDSMVEKTQKEMKANPPKQVDPAKREALGQALKEIIEFRRRGEHPKKYY